MNKNVRIILDSNGVIQQHAVRTARRFFLGLVFQCKMTPATYVRLMRRVRGNAAGKMNAEETKYISQFYIQNRHIQIPLMRGARQTVNRLISEHPGRVYVCSANAFSPDSDAKYRDWFMQTFPGLAGVHFVPAFHTKGDFYREIHEKYPRDTVIVVDDAKRHIEEATALGLDTRYINRRDGYKNLHDAFYGRVK